MTRGNNDECICACEPPRYLRGKSDKWWHLRDASEDAGCVCVPLCEVRYSDHSSIVGSRRPASEPICPDCARIYLETVDDDPELTSSLLTSLALLGYVERTPRMEKTLLYDAQVRLIFKNVQSMLYHVAESLILAGQNQPFVRSIIDRVISKTMPSETDLAEEADRSVERAKKFGDPLLYLASQLVAELFGEDDEDDDKDKDKDKDEDKKTPPASWSATLAPVGVRGCNGQIISPECVITVAEVASIFDEERTPVGRVVSASIVDGYLTVTGVFDEDVYLDDLLSLKPTFDGGVRDRRSFGSSDDPTVTFETLEINAVRFGHAGAIPAWSDPRIAFTRVLSGEPEKSEETPVEV